jgi:orotate phosphoribosyltransferase-like protein
VTDDMSDEREVRDRHIRDLSEQGGTQQAIGDEVGLSAQRVGQILARHPITDEAMDAYEQKLRAELELLLVNRQDHARRIRVIEHALLRLEQEREEIQLDRILGLR